MSKQPQKKNTGPVLLHHPLNYPLLHTPPFYSTYVEQNQSTPTTGSTSSGNNFLTFHFTHSQSCFPHSVKSLSFLFDFILEELLHLNQLVPIEEEKEFYESLSPSSSNKEDLEMSETDSHQIQYDHDIVKKFVAELSETIKRKQTKTTGVDEKSYERLWNQLTNNNLATVYLTVLLGKLLILEEKALKLKQELTENNENDQYVDDKEISLQEVIDCLNLGSQKYDAHHPLLAKRKEVKNRYV